MMTRTLFVALAGLILFSSTAVADAPLKTALGLSVDQAKVVDEIQAKHRKLFAAKRGERNREMRKLRRARLENDSKAIAEQEAVTEKLTVELRAIRESEDAAIRKVLNPEQNKKFDAYIEQRRAMVGSSRDEGDIQ